MPTIAEIRSKYPQYSDLSDAALADALHSKFYSDMPRDAFNAKVGFSAAPPSIENTLDAAKPDGYFATQRQMAEAGMDAMSRGGGQFADAFRFAASGAGRDLREDTPANRVAGGFDALEGRKTPLSEGEYEGARSESVANLTKGYGNLLSGAAEYITSPINAGLRVYAGKPIEDATGVPKELTEFALGLALPVPGKIPGVGSAKAPKSATKASEIFAEAKPYYREFDAEAKDVFVSPKEVSERVVTALNNAKQPEHLAEEVHKTVAGFGSGGKAPTAFQKLEAEMNGLPVPGRESDLVPLTELRDLKELVGKSFQSSDSRVRAAAAAASKEITKIISEISPSAGQNLKTADEIYSTARSLRDLQQKSSIADLRAGRAGYGGNAVNTMRQVLSPIVQKSIEGKVTGYKPEEIQAMREIIEGTGVTNTLRTIGQLSPTKALGGIPTAGAIGGAYAAGSALPLLLPIAGAASNKLATVLTGRQIDRLKELVASRSPVTKRLEGPSGRFEQMAIDFQTNPTPQNLARVTLAARNLSTNLKDAGITVSPNELLKSLQGPMGGRAEDEQP